MEFLTRAKSVNQSVISAGIKASPNALLKHFLNQMMLTTLLQPHTTSINMRFAKVIKQKGMHYEYQDHTVTSICTLLERAFPLNTELPMIENLLPQYRSYGKKYHGRPYQRQNTGEDTNDSQLVPRYKSMSH